MPVDIVQGSRRTQIQLADEKLLAELGYKQEFKREFTPIEVFGISFSIIGLLPSMASVLFYSLPNGGPSAMVWGWFVACIFITLIALSMAELASAAPTSGGLYYWTHTFTSPRWRNLLAWIIGYANTIGGIASVASVDWGAAVQVMAAVSIALDGTYTPTNAQLFAVYAAIILSHAVICSLGTHVLARLQNIYIVMNVLLCLGVIIALPAATPKELWNSANFALGNFTNLYDWPNGYAFILSFLAPQWTICSFDSSVHISEEASNAATAVPYAIIWAAVVASVLGFAINIALAFCMGTDIQGIMNGSAGQPMAQIFFNSFGKHGTLVIWSFIILVQYMMGSSTLLVSSRQTFAFARDGALPLSSILYRMNKFTGTPVNTVWAVATISLLLGLLVFAGAQAINAVFALSVTGIYIACGTPIAARWIWRKENGFTGGAFSLGVFSFPVALISVSFMSFMIIVFLFPTTRSTSVADMNYTVVLLGSTLVLAVGWYYFPIYGGVNWFTGPVRTTEDFQVQGALGGQRGASDILGVSSDGSAELAWGRRKAIEGRCVS